MEQISRKSIEVNTLDTRSTNVKYFKDFNDVNLDNSNDKEFKKMISKLTGMYDKTVLITESIISHYGFVNDNYRYYDEAFADKNAKTLYYPFNKPVLLGHDTYSDPLGRVLKAEYVSLGVKSNGLRTRKGYINAYSYIIGNDNIEKIMDNRYLTVSVGSVADNVRCSICDCNLVNSYCEHELGEKYDGKLAYMIYNEIDYSEYSYVNVPADKHAMTSRYEIIIPEDQAKDSYSDLIINTIQNKQGKIKTFNDDKYKAYITNYTNDLKNNKAYSICDDEEISLTDVFFKKNKIKENNVNLDKNIEPQQKEINKMKNSIDLEDNGVSITKDAIDTIVHEIKEKAEYKYNQLKKHSDSIEEKLSAAEDEVTQNKKNLQELKDKLEKYEKKEKEDLTKQYVDCLIELKKPQVSEIIDETDENKKQELKQKQIDTYKDQSIASIDFALSQLNVELLAKSNDKSETIQEKVEDDVSVNVDKDTKPKEKSFRDKWFNS